MPAPPDTMKVAVPVTGAVLVIFFGAGLATPLEGGTAPGPVGSDCRLMAQALHEAGRGSRVIAANRRCDWRGLGFPRAIDYDDLPPGTESGSRTVETPRYGLGGYRAEVDVGVVLAPLAGWGQNCTYYRFFGRWLRAGCHASWIS